MPCFNTTLSHNLYIRKLFAPVPTPTRMDIVSIIKAACLLLLLFCAMLGAFGAQMQATDGADAKIYLYKLSSGPITVYYTDTSFGCGALDSTMDAAFAFALLSWITIAAGVAVAAVAIFKKDLIPAIANLAVSAAAWVFLTLSWVLVVVMYYTKYCGASSNLKENAKFDYGFGFLILSWILATCWVAFEALSLLNLIPAVAQQRTVPDEEKQATA